MKSIDDEFHYSFIQNSNIQKNITFVHRLQLIHNSRRGSSVATLDAVRENDPPGGRQGTKPMSSCAA